MAIRGPGQMPPIGTNERDLAGESLLSQWIISLANPVISPPGRIVNLAARASVGTGANGVMAGFVIAPGSNRTVLVRGIGPALASAPFNVRGALADPVLTLFGPNSSTRVASSNDNWGAGDTMAFAAAGAFPLPAGSRDAALVAELSPGSYTVQLGTSGQTGGVALLEVYDASPASDASTSRLVNAAVRAQVGASANDLIPGLVISGGPKTVLLRAVGPGIAEEPFSVSGTLAEPVLSLYIGSQAVATNAAWNSATNAAAIRENTRSVGAFPLAEGSHDSVILATLPAGAYTLRVSGADNSSGVVLVEVYEVP